MCPASRCTDCEQILFGLPSRVGTMFVDGTCELYVVWRRGPETSGSRRWLRRHQRRKVSPSEMHCTGPRCHLCVGREVSDSPIRDRVVGESTVPARLWSSPDAQAAVASALLMLDVDQTVLNSITQPLKTLDFQHRYSRESGNPLDRLSEKYGSGITKNSTRGFQHQTGNAANPRRR